MVTSLKTLRAPRQVTQIFEPGNLYKNVIKATSTHGLIPMSSSGLVARTMERSMRATNYWIERDQCHVQLNCPSIRSWVRLVARSYNQCRVLPQFN